MYHEFYTSDRCVDNDVMYSSSGLSNRSLKKKSELVIYPGFGTEKIIPDHTGHLSSGTSQVQQGWEQSPVLLRSAD